MISQIRLRGTLLTRFSRMSPVLSVRLWRLVAAPDEKVAPHPLHWWRGSPFPVLPNER